MESVRNSKQQQAWNNRPRESENAFFVDEVDVILIVRNRFDLSKIFFPHTEASEFLLNDKLGKVAHQGKPISMIADVFSTHIIISYITLDVMNINFVE